MTSRQDLGDADRGHGEIIALAGDADREPDPAGDAGGAIAASRPTGTGRAKPPRCVAVERGGDDRRGIGADREEAGDAGIEETADAPLDVEAEAEDRIDAADDQEADEVEGPAA